MERKKGKMVDKRTDIFDKWFRSLPFSVQEVVNDYICRVLEGNNSKCHALREGISEIVIDFQKGYRVYYTLLENKTILLLLFGGNKGGHGKWQNKDIERAIGMKKYLRRSKLI